MWTDIFTNVAGNSSLSIASIFTGGVEYYDATYGVLSSPGSTQGAFTFNGTDLNWTAVPEPTSALAAVLLGAGLLRRRTPRTWRSEKSDPRATLRPRID